MPRGCSNRSREDSYAECGGEPIQKLSDTATPRRIGVSKPGDLSKGEPKNPNGFVRCRQKIVVSRRYVRDGANVIKAKKPFDYTELVRLIGFR
jgi:hypothetical protein